MKRITPLDAACAVPKDGEEHEFVTDAGRGSATFVPSGFGETPIDLGTLDTCERDLIAIAPAVHRILVGQKTGIILVSQHPIVGDETRILQLGWTWKAPLLRVGSIDEDFRFTDMIITLKQT